MLRLLIYRGKPIQTWKAVPLIRTSLTVDGTLQLLSLFPYLIKDLLLIQANQFTVFHKDLAVTYSGYDASAGHAEQDVSVDVGSVHWC